MDATDCVSLRVTKRFHISKSEQSEQSDNFVSVTLSSIADTDSFNGFELL